MRRRRGRQVAHCSPLGRRRPRRDRFALHCDGSDSSCSVRGRRAPAPASAVRAHQRPPPGRDHPRRTGYRCEHPPVRTTDDRPTLSHAAFAFRAAHTALAVVDVGALGYIWFCALTRRRDRRLLLSTGALLVEGVALVVGRGNCPLGPLQRRLGDPTPLFELVLPPRAAKAAVPVLAGASLIGLMLAWRPPAAEAAG